MLTTIHPVTAVLTRLREQLDGNLQTFVLIDPLLGEPASPVPTDPERANSISARCLRWGRPIEPVELCKSIPLPQHQHPYLIVLRGADDPLLEFTVETALEERSQALANGLAGTGGAAHRIGGWLQSDHPPSQIACQIGEMCRLNFAPGATGRYLRIGDRRTLAFLHHFLGGERIGSQLSRVRRWCYLNALGKPAGMEGIDSSMNPLRFSSDEWALLRKGEEIHRTACKWLGELQLLGADCAPPDANRIYPTVLRAVDDAADLARKYPWRFKTVGDITTWAAMSLAYPAITNAEPVRHFLANKVADGAASICSIYASLGDLLPGEPRPAVARTE